MPVLRRRVTGDRIAAAVSRTHGAVMRMQLANMRVVQQPERAIRPIDVLIALWEERLSVASTDPRIGVGAVTELIEMTLPHLRKLQALEAQGRA